MYPTTHNRTTMEAPASCHPRTTPKPKGRSLPPPPPLCLAVGTQPAHRDTHPRTFCSPGLAWLATWSSSSKSFFLQCIRRIRHPTPANTPAIAQRRQLPQRPPLTNRWVPTFTATAPTPQTPRQSDKVTLFMKISHLNARFLAQRDGVDDAHEAVFSFSSLGSQFAGDGVDSINSSF